MCCDDRKAKGMKFYNLRLTPAEIAEAVLGLGVDLPDTAVLGGAYVEAGEGGKVKALVVTFADPGAVGDPEELAPEQEA